MSASSAAFAFGRFQLPKSQVFLVTPLSFAFVNLKPLVPGHVLIASRRVAPRLNDLSDDEHEDLWKTARKVSKALESGLSPKPDGFNVAVQDGVCAGQSVPHVHIHILPRSNDDFEDPDAVHKMIEAWQWHSNGFEKPVAAWPIDEDRKPRSDEEMAKEASKMRSLCSPNDNEKHAAQKEDPSTHRRLISILEKSGIEYKATEHEAVLTSEQAAQVRGGKLEEGAKAMLLRIKYKKSVQKPESFALCVMAAHAKLDSKVFRKMVGAKSVSFATTEEVADITGCISGAVPPFASAFRKDITPCYMDTSLRSVETIEFNAGLRTKSVRMKQADYEAIEKPTVCQFTASIL